MSEFGMGVHVLLADRYQLEELLGSGAMGEVWRAADQVLGRPVAIKLLKAADTADIERFRMEAQTTARLNHPHVVGVYDFGSDHGRLHLVMELVDGWTLARERSQRGTLAAQEAAAIAAQVAQGLSAAHRQGVIHRDIKPANVMLTTDRTVKITDFGIARFTDESAGTATGTGKILGTADYLAPERALGRSAQPASDVYSLGCVLYELLTGRPPFTGTTSLAVVQQHVDAAPPPPHRLSAGIPRQLSDYVLRLLAKDPAQRPTAEGAAEWLGAQEWEANPTEPTEPLDPVDPAEPESVTLSPTSAPPPRTRTPATHSRRRNRRRQASKALLGGAAVALFAAATALGAALNSGGDNPASTVSPSPAPTRTPSSTPTAVTSRPASGTATAPATPPSAVPSTRPTPPKPKDHKDKQHDGKDKHGKDRTKGRKGPAG
ncbi:serine/threonine-protein kinase [Streptomyces sp. NRRL S-646]|uniref:serine/threonine-protein kinase n=1 Tax=Streptomyces sp. NRRL S-646 TaxID=1463917 RepID=UPI00056A89E3|nr:serine/threonine-protein kinase [Streptomyces sp. NRRL S-646]